MRPDAAALSHCRAKAHSKSPPHLRLRRLRPLLIPFRATGVARRAPSLIEVRTEVSLFELRRRLIRVRVERPLLIPLSDGSDLSLSFSLIRR